MIRKDLSASGREMPDVEDRGRVRCSRMVNAADPLNIRSCSRIRHWIFRNKRPADRVVSGKREGTGSYNRKGEVRMRTTLWVTTAAAALIAGSTFAGAQTGKTNEGGPTSGSGQMSQSQGSTQKGASQGSTQKGAEQKGAASEHKSPGMAQGKEERAEKKGAEGKAERSSQADKAQGPKAQQGKQPGMAQGKEERTGKKGAEGKEQRSTQAGEKTKGAKGAEKNKPGMAQEKGGATTGQSTTGQQKPGTTETQRGTTETQRGTSETRSSTSSSGSVQLSQEQRTKVHSVIVKESSARVDTVDFSISVGTTVPQHIHGKLRQLPRELVEIFPQYREYRFILVRDELIIIDPNTLRIVAVIPV
jgi:hypothetical protein